MRLQFRHQKFQSDAANAICEVFNGQPFHSPTYMIDPGLGQIGLEDARSFTGFNNAPVVIGDNKILENIRNIQRSGQIKPSESLDGRYNLTVEMETGVGKTYTYIKTMYELNKRYGWSKFIIVVPSVAIREGVYKSFQMTEDHFAEDYGKKIRYFIYNSAQLTELDRFASDSSINAMIINSQAFNARGKDARRIYMKLDDFRSRRPIDILAKTNPILIIDEPQSVEGAATKERLKEFTPLATLRYSATHRADSVYNMIYRLDALEAYNKKLVKKIAVKGISVSGSTATEGYIYIQSINLSKGNPTATIEFDIKGKTGIRKVSRIVTEGYNLFDNSGELAEYKDGYTILRIDGRDSSVEFTNGKKLYAGDVIGSVSEEQLRRIQIRETILSHIERERQLFAKGIKVLSLFFIDEVAKYRQYDAQGNTLGGTYAQIFEEEYKAIVGNMQLSLDDAEGYLKYIESISVNQTHAGYFSIDKKSGRIIDSKLGDKKERTSDDADAYDLIMKDKERLLDRREPVRFIFSHSALREGWDNPNVFQICTLKQSGSDVRKRQEVGRGLRLSVNQVGERMDENVLSHEEIHNINVLTVIANESYDSFAKGLQSEIAEAVADRPRKVQAKLFEEKFGEDTALVIYESLIENGYIKRGELTEKYYEAKQNGSLEVPEEISGHIQEVISVLDSVYDPNINKPENARKNTVNLTLDKDKLNSRAFQELWSRINSRSYYTVSFDEDELINRAITELNSKLRVSKIYFKVEKGEQTKKIESKAQLQAGEAFVRADMVREEASSYLEMKASSSVRYDLVGKIVSETGMTRKTVASILVGIEKSIFDQFGNNPEEFILRAANIINEQKATAIIEHITYDKLTSKFSTNIFTEPDLKKGALGVNAIEAKRHLYDYVIYDSTNERDFANQLETHSQEVEVYVKLPKGFYINTPVGKYNPDWAIAFYEGKVKHIYFVAETKGDMSSMELREIEKAKAHCAREHFRAISGENIKYDVVSSYDKLWELVQG
ncbi:DEAD/DEAH box helicase family protein [Dehalobacterium formicoaceticum]|uniref:DEAD/DEAH box helicase family protein n=1 Tax=Dehalobacterium formicoaceticum TaxID=51515 RepID=A0ABT1Y8G6_9FIRM|nr:DEAD/DEAH box helicase family protein [Dehalobacterium formicoaceticum]MCR6547175.1 DEAD/DEAH box helicase family protein [Dehalobacterium formicoaceticum]